MKISIRGVSVIDKRSVTYKAFANGTISYIRIGGIEYRFRDTQDLSLLDFNSARMALATDFLVPETICVDGGDLTAEIASELQHYMPYLIIKPSMTPVPLRTKKTRKRKSKTKASTTGKATRQVVFY